MEFSSDAVRRSARTWYDDPQIWIKLGIMVTELPTFETERLRLREAVESDLQDLWSIWNDPGVRRFLFDDTQVELEQASEVLASCRALTPQGLGMWVVEPKGERLTARSTACAFIPCHRWPS